MVVRMVLGDKQQEMTVYFILSFIHSEQVKTNVSDLLNTETQ
jgi:hypothetical protein